jgi:hypothetical protein
VSVLTLLLVFTIMRNVMLIQFTFIELVRLIARVDYVVLIARTRRDLVELFSSLEGAARSTGLKIIQNKTLCVCACACVCVCERERI